MAGVAGTRYKSASGHNFVKMDETKIRNHMLEKKAIYKISNQSGERRKRSCGDKIGQTEGWTE